MVRVCQLRRHTHRSAILGIHGLKKRPVVVDGAVVVRPMCYVGLTYDHRCVLVQPAKGPGAPPPCCPTHLRTRKRDCPVRCRKSFCSTPGVACRCFSFRRHTLCLSAPCACLVCSMVEQREAMAFLLHIKACVEDPRRLLLEY